VKILAEAEPALPLTLGDVVDAASASEAVRVRVEIFFAERLEFYLREAKGQAYDVVKAVLAAGRTMCATPWRGRGGDGGARQRGFCGGERGVQADEEYSGAGGGEGISEGQVEMPTQVSVEPAQNGLMQRWSGLREILQARG